MTQFRESVARDIRQWQAHRSRSIPRRKRRQRPSNQVNFRLQEQRQSQSRARSNMRPSSTALDPVFPQSSFVPTGKPWTVSALRQRLQERAAARHLHDRRTRKDAASTQAEQSSSSSRHEHRRSRRHRQLLAAAAASTSEAEAVTQAASEAPSKGNPYERESSVHLAGTVCKDGCDSDSTTSSSSSSSTSIAGVATWLQFRGSEATKPRAESGFSHHDRERASSSRHNTSTTSNCMSTTTLACDVPIDIEGDHTSDSSHASDTDAEETTAPLFLPPVPHSTLPPRHSTFPSSPSSPSSSSSSSSSSASSSLASLVSSSVASSSASPQLSPPTPPLMPPLLLPFITKPTKPTTTTTAMLTNKGGLASDSTVDPHWSSDHARKRHKGPECMEVSTRDSAGPQSCTPVIDPSFSSPSTSAAASSPSPPSTASRSSSAPWSSSCSSSSLPSYCPIAETQQQAPSTRASESTPSRQDRGGHSVRERGDREQRTRDPLPVGACLACKHRHGQLMALLTSLLRDGRSDRPRGGDSSVDATVNDDNNNDSSNNNNSISSSGIINAHTATSNNNVTHPACSAAATSAWMSVNSVLTVECAVSMPLHPLPLPQLLRLQLLPNRGDGGDGGDRGEGEERKQEVQDDRVQQERVEKKAEDEGERDHNTKEQDKDGMIGCNHKSQAGEHNAHCHPQHQHHLQQREEEEYQRQQEATPWVPLPLHDKGKFFRSRAWLRRSLEADMPKSDDTHDGHDDADAEEELRRSGGVSVQGDMATGHSNTAGSNEDKQSSSQPFFCHNTGNNTDSSHSSDSSMEYSSQGSNSECEGPGCGISHTNCASRCISTTSEHSTRACNESEDCGGLGTAQERERGCGCDGEKCVDPDDVRLYQRGQPTGPLLRAQEMQRDVADGRILEEPSCRCIDVSAIKRRVCSLLRQRQGRQPNIGSI